MRPLRSLLFVPGNRERYLAKLAQVRPDAVILDLEDSVPEQEKETARATVADLVRTERFAQHQLLVRVNPFWSGLTPADLRAVVSRSIVGVFLPKVETANELREANMLLSEAEAKAGLEMGHVRLLPILETTRGILNAQELAGCGRRVLGVAFGYEDFTLDLGIPRTREGRETLYPRAHLAMAARAAGVLAIDGPTSDYRDQALLEAEARTSRGLGFTGKQCVHPGQIETLNRVFTPSAEDVSHAREIVAAYERVAARGHGSTSLGGSMLDAPVVQRARRVIELYERIAGEVPSLELPDDGR